MSLTHGWIQAKNARLFYEMQGQGPPVVLLHGGFVDRRQWDPQFDELAGHFQVVRLDGRGHGRSDAPLAEFSYARDLVALLDQLQLAPAVLVGFSRSCSVALTVAFQHPARVSGLVLAAPGLTSFPYSAEYVDYLQNLLITGESGHTGQAIQTILDDPYWRLEEGRTREREWLKGILADNGHLFRWYMEATHRDEEPMLPHLAEIQAPTLLVGPQRDYPDNQQVFQMLAGRLPAVQVVTVPEAGHFVTVDQPEVFNRETIRFIDSLP
ncbi:MAG: alpha/beta hydrolase [Acidobacteria bacterium]|nr:alpha/beta hydrolase [Acidobacteriota bacterium]